MIQNLGLLLLVGAVVSILLIVLGVSRLASNSTVAVERFHSYTSAAEYGADEDAGSLPQRSDEWLARRGLGSGIAQTLAQADIKLTVTEYLLLHAVLLAAGAGAGYGLLHSLPTAVLVGVFLLPLPHLYVSSVKAKRLQAFAQQLPNALTSLANALRGGYGIAQAMSLTAEEMTPPMSTELRRVVAETGYGLPYDTAFRNMLRRNPSDDLSLVVTALELHLEMGGNLSEILDNIGAIVRDRVRIHMQVKALTASQRFSATIVTALPFGIVAVMYVLNRSYISQLWTTTPGLIILAIAVVLVVTGTIVLRRVSTIKV